MVSDVSGCNLARGSLPTAALWHFCYRCGLCFGRGTCVTFAVILFIHGWPGMSRKGYPGSLSNSHNEFVYFLQSYGLSLKHLQNSVYPSKQHVSVQERDILAQLLLEHRLTKSQTEEGLRIVENGQLVGLLQQPNIKPVNEAYLQVQSFKSR